MDTAIFEYVIRGEKRYADPSEILDTLQSYCGGSVHECVKLSRSENPDQAKEYRARLRAAVAAAFGLVPFDPATGAGAHHHELLGLLWSFYEWKEKKNPNIGSWPTSPPSTGSESSAPGSAPVESPSPIPFSSVFG